MKLLKKEINDNQILSEQINILNVKNKDYVILKMKINKNNIKKDILIINH